MKRRFIDRSPLSLKVRAYFLYRDNIGSPQGDVHIVAIGTILVLFNGSPCKLHQTRLQLTNVENVVGGCLVS
jgi:hypothetical protein